MNNETEALSVSFKPEVPCMLLKDVPLPSYAHDGDAGLDLRATEDITLYPGESYKMGSGVAVAIPYGYAGFVVPRSGLGSKGLVIKHTIGIIDAPYRGEIGLTLFNNNPTHRWDKIAMLVPNLDQFGVKGAIHIKKGDRIAQLVILPVAMANLVLVDELDETTRDVGGFGSTGVS